MSKITLDIVLIRSNGYKRNSEAFNEYYIRFFGTSGSVILDDTNESNNTISKESSGHQNNVKSYSEGFVGTWNDLYSQRCQMTIESDVDGIYTILIHWVDSASENNRWEFTGQYDSTQNEIVYHGV